MSNPIYDDVRAHYLADDVPAQPPGPDPATTMLPAVDPRPPWAGEGAGAEDLTHDDYLVRRTNNGLRLEDAALEQPPQDPDWRPDADS